jgi:hypothetical protein
MAAGSSRTHRLYKSAPLHFPTSFFGNKSNTETRNSNNNNNNNNNNKKFNLFTHSGNIFCTTFMCPSPLFQLWPLGLAPVLRRCSQPPSSGSISSPLSGGHHAHDRKLCSLLNIHLTVRVRTKTVNKEVNFVSAVLPTSNCHKRISSSFNRSKAKTIWIYILRLSPYRAVNTLRLGFKNHSVNAV